jgi:RNA polymerase sigma-70 factor (ECF subfamily)
MLGDAAEAQDVLQEGFVSLWRSAARLDPTRGSLAGWLLATTRRRAIDRLRARRAKGGGAIDVDPASVPGGARSPLDGASAAEARAKASAAVATLPAEERRVIELAYFEGLSQSEIAERTGSPLGTVKGRTRNALSRLRAVLPRSLGGEA